MVLHPHGHRLGPRSPEIEGFGDGGACPPVLVQTGSYRKLQLPHRTLRLI